MTDERGTEYLSEIRSAVLEGVQYWRLNRPEMENLARAADTIDALTAERDALREALERIAQWSEAYPTKVFPKPDLARAAAVLSAAGMSLDVISADNMRHATEGVGQIARAALKGEK